MNPWLDGRRDVFPPSIHLSSIQQSFCSCLLMWNYWHFHLLKEKLTIRTYIFSSPLLPIFFVGAGGWERLWRPAKLQITAAIIDLTDKTSLRLINLWRFYSKNPDKHLLIRRRDADLLPETISSESQPHKCFEKFLENKCISRICCDWLCCSAAVSDDNDVSSEKMILNLLSICWISFNLATNFFHFSNLSSTAEEILPPVPDASPSSICSKLK